MLIIESLQIKKQQWTELRRLLILLMFTSLSEVQLAVD